jgi:hypothetical protein
MDNIITVRRLWDNGELAVGFCPVSVQCSMLTGATPRNVWLTPVPNCLVPSGYVPNLSAPDPLPAGTILGVWLEFLDGTSMAVDAISVQAVINACNACCGGTGEVASRYGGLIPSPAPCVASTYVISRSDQGDDYAYQRMSLDYWGNGGAGSYISGTFLKLSHDPATGLTQYSFQSCINPTLQGTDTLISSTPQTVISNAGVVAPGGGAQLVLTFTNQNGPVVPKITATTPALLVTALNASALYNTYGTWSYDTPSQTIRLVPNASVEDAAISVVTKSAATEFLSNDPGAPAGGQQVQLTAVIDGQTPALISAATVAALVTALNASATYNIYGTWSASGTALKLTSWTVSNAQLSLALITP